MIFPVSFLTAGSGFAAADRPPPLPGDIDPGEMARGDTALRRRNARRGPAFRAAPAAPHQLTRSPARPP